MNEIFISYKVHNRAKAIEYYKILKEKGYQVWFDQLIPQGQNWQTTITKKIAECKCVLCLLSKQALINDWVLKQVKLAKKHNKQIIFLIIDSSDIKIFKAFKIDNYYVDFKEIDFANYYRDNNLDEYKYLVKEARKSYNHPFLITGLYTIITIFLLCYGLKLLNLNLNTNYGYLSLGITGLLLFTFIPKKWIYPVNTVIGAGLLSYCIYGFDNFYISGISINASFFIGFYIFAMLFRYSQYKLPINILLSLFYTMFVVVTMSSLMIFFKYFFDIDISFIAFGVYVFFAYLNYSKHNLFCLKNADLKGFIRRYFDEK